jgi:uncharacterized membrane protein
MWFAPEAVKLPSNMRFYPDYDSAMFMAAMTILPSLALFVFSVETNFFNYYRRFYGNILAHASLRRIRALQKNIFDSILEGGRNTVLMQGAIALLVILLAPQIFERVGMFFMQLGMFRLAVLGSFFQVLLLFATIILAYFDCRRLNVGIFFFYLVANILLTLLFLNLGFEYYGYGFFLSSALAFLLAAGLLFSHVRKLPYHAFITNNDSVRKAGIYTETNKEHGRERGEFAMGVIRNAAKEE